MQIFSALTLTLIITFIPMIAHAQDPESLALKMQGALKTNDNKAALEYAESLYTFHKSLDDYAGMGQAAFSKGKILDFIGESLIAGHAYDDCTQSYEKIQSDAQALQCQYLSAQAYSVAGKSATALDRLEDSVQKLESFDQGKSQLAANVYLSLANEVLPSKLKRLRGASSRRKDSVEYADLALQAFEANQQTQSIPYGTTLYIKGNALEDLEKYDQAKESYAAAINVFKNQNNFPESDLENAMIRLSIVSKLAEGDDGNETINVQDSGGNEILLVIDKKHKVQFPRVNRNQIVDGAKVRALITLKKEGAVDKIEIIQSSPDPAFGKAFKKAVKKWEFLPRKDISTNDIPPFEYGMVFFVTRR